MKHPEDDIQRAVIEHLRRRGAPGIVYFHTPNGGRRNPREAARFKAMGVRAGVADLILVHNGHIFALELKTLEGRATVPQLHFMSDMRDAGAHTAVALGLDQALAVLETWGLLKLAVNSMADILRHVEASA